ncbi:hypothetical protein KY289_016472 [Solanum tuberosum]|nr:hypothetical protein KY289_016472 [Solanum tuberosum]
MRVENQRFDDCYLQKENLPFQLKIQEKSGGIDERTQCEKERVLMEGPYYVNNQPLILKQWELDFELDKEALSIVPLWVKFPGLPVGYWSVEALSKVASAVGRLIHIDRFTENAERISYARILIEVDVSQPLTEEGKYREGWSRVGEGKGRVYKNAEIQRDTIEKGTEMSEVIIQRSVFAMNELTQRERLWANLNQVDVRNNFPWILCGDFNKVLSSEDRMGSHVSFSEVEGFQVMLDSLQLTPLRSTGWYFTWCNKQEAGRRVYSKIDWALGDLKLLQQYGPFRFYPNIMEHPDFRSTMNQVGDGDHWTAYGVAREKLDIIQRQIQDDVMNQMLFDREKMLLLEIEKWSKVEEHVLRQKSRATWKELIKEVTQEEIIEAIKSMPKEKAPGVDGFPIEFFTGNWDIVK